MARASVPRSPMLPPRSEVGVVGWLRHNLFSTAFDTALTLIGLFVLYKVVATLIRWAKTSRAVCSLVTAR